MMLVVDYVWSAAQLRPFLIGARRCRRLVTTRNGAVLPRSARSVLFDAMEHGEAVSTLTNGLGGMSPATVGRLLELTGRWPLLLSLVSVAIREQRRQGATVEQASDWVARRLAAHGPAGLDLDDAESRETAVAASVRSSLDLLSPSERERYFDLSVFPEAVDIPADILALLWAATGGLERGAADRLRDKLISMRLAIGSWHFGGPALRMHDVSHSYLRHHQSAAELAGRHRRLLDGARSLPGPLPRTTTDPTPWWLLPDEADYLWRYLGYHLARSGERAELAALVRDPRWLLAAGCWLLAAGCWLLAAGCWPGSSDTAPSRWEPTWPWPTTTSPGSCAAPSDRRRTCWSRWNPASRTPCCPGSTGPPRAITSSRAPDRCWQAHTSPRPGRSRTGRTPRSTEPWKAIPARFVDAPPHRTADGSPPRASTAPSGSGPWTPARCVLRGHLGWVWDCAFAPDGTWLASAGDDGPVRIWDLAAKALQRTLETQCAVTSCPIAPDGSWLASAGADRTVRVWGTRTAALEATLLGDTGGANSCAVSPDGSWLASASSDTMVRIWHRQRGVSANHEEARTSREADARTRVTTVSMRAIATSPDGTRIVTANTDGTVRLWDMPSGQLRDVIGGDLGELFGCAIAPDGTWLVSTGTDQLIRIWDTATGATLTTLAGHTGRVSDCGISSSGEWLVTASFDRTMRIWDARTAEERAVLAGETGPIWGCAISPDDRRIADVSTNGTIRIWNAHTAACETALRVEQPVRDCAWLDNSNLCVAGNAGLYLLAYDRQ